MNLSDYLRLPWTVERSDHDDDGGYIALHISELPGFVVAARTPEDADALFGDALSAFLSSYLENGEEPPSRVDAG
jgi:predicted RNase H-like HicB family nuclease